MWASTAAVRRFVHVASTGLSACKASKTFLWAPKVPASSQHWALVLIACKSDSLSHVSAQRSQSMRWCLPQRATLCKRLRQLRLPWCCQASLHVVSLWAQAASKRARASSSPLEQAQQEFKTACPDGFEVVMDGVGGTLQEAFLGNLVPGAKVLLTGYISEYPHNEDTVVSNGAHTDRLSNADIFWNKQEADLGDGKVITGKTWPQTKEEMARCRALAWEMYSSGTVTALVDDKPFHGLEKIPDAVEHMLSGQAIGKVVVSL